MVITNFSNGELSQNLKGRVDIPAYFSGCQRLTNFEIIPTGGIQRRVGFKRLGELKENCRLIPFIVDKNTSFLLEFIPAKTNTSGKIYFWKNGIRMKTLDNEDYSVDTEYTSIAEINEIQYAQNYDVMIFVQRNHRPLKVVYNAGFQSFSAEPMELDYFIEPNLDDDYGIIKEVTEEYLPLEGKTGDYCIYKGHLWKCIKGSTETYSAEWEIDGEDPSTDTGLWKREEDLKPNESNDGKYPGCVSFFQNRLYFAGTKNDPQRIWASATPDTEGTRYTQFGTYQKFITTNKSIKNPDAHLFTATITRDGVAGGQTILSSLSQDFTEEGRLEKYDYDTAKFLEDYFITNTDYFPIGTKVVSFTANTMVLDHEAVVTWDEGQAEKAGIVFNISLWKNTETASADDYEFVVVNNNMTTSDCSFYLEPASDQNDAVKWLAPSNFLCVGTETNVWNIPSGVSALNVAALMNGRYGSDDIQAHVVDTAVIFFAQGKKGIREYYYNNEREAFQTNNIAIMAEQMLKESPAVDFDFCTNPYNRIVITRGDGTAVTLLYDKNNGVMGWNRIEHAHGQLKSCAITRGDGYSDLIYFAVYDNGSYFLEVMDAESEVYLDSWTVENKADITDYTEIVNAGKAYVEKGDYVYIGYEFESVILSMPVVTQDISQKKRIVNLYVRFNDSYMPVMQTTGKPDEYFNGVEQPFSGVKKIDYPGVSDIDVTFQFSFKKPERCNILSVDASIA